MMSLLLQRLADKVDVGAIRAIDYQFARYISEQAGATTVLVLWAAQLSYRAGQGHICLPLKQRQYWFDMPRAEQQQLFNGISNDADGRPLEEVMLTCGAVSQGDQPTPLVVSDNRLYLARHWLDEQQVAAYINQHVRPVATTSALPQTLDQLFTPYYPILKQQLASADNDEQRRRAVIDCFDIVDPRRVPWQRVEPHLTPDSTESLLALAPLIPAEARLNWQKVAAAAAISSQFSVISGGPGTGKTTTVVRLLAAWISEHNALPPLIKLVAPTGKAAARLTESIGGALRQLAVDDTIKAAIPVEATTLHRLLGAIPNRSAFRHNARNPLHLDILVVDEASMVDLSMMARLMSALPPHAKLVLLGDKDQLASVEAGSVLGDICRYARQGYSVDRAAQLSSLTGFEVPTGSPTAAVADSLCVLQKSHRFHARSGIGQLAGAVNAGSVERLAAVWQQGFNDIEHVQLDADSYPQLIEALCGAYRPYIEAAKRGESPKDVIDAFNGVRLLCALREGDTGVEGINLRLERALRQQQLISDNDELWYVGRPVMITQNDHGLGLSNGDIGITLYDAEHQRLRVYFEMPDGTVKGMLPSRLPSHDNAYAMTIHKSQGSEFAHTYLLLPEKMSPVITRELIYTGITRAKSRLTLYCDPAVMQQGIVRRTERMSGLPRLLERQS